MAPLFDVIAVNMIGHKIRIIGEGKTFKDALAVEWMAVDRIGTDDEFFITAQAGKYRAGDIWNELA